MWIVREGPELTPRPRAARAMKRSAPVRGGSRPVRHGLARVLSKHGVCSRSQTALLIAEGRVSVNGRTVKASYQVKVGDVIEIGFGQRTLKVEVTEINETANKASAPAMYRELE